VGSPEVPASAIWRVVVQRNEVYLGMGRFPMGLVKMSLHSSGVWTLAFTKQSGNTGEDGNRRAMQWRRPDQDAFGVVRGPSVVVPYTHLTTSAETEPAGDKPVYWRAPPSPGNMVEFRVCFAPANASPSWEPVHTQFSAIPLPNGDTVRLLVSERTLHVPEMLKIERVLRENKFTGHATDGGRLFWHTSDGASRTPIIVDLPLPLKVIGER
jgi:hypothetical protein